MSDSRSKKLERRKRRILWRLRERQWPEQAKPMFASGNIQHRVLTFAAVFAITKGRIQGSGNGSAMGRLGQQRLT